MAAASPGPDGPRPYRLSDAERDEAISALADAFAAGRLDATEFERRMSLACQAVFATDLDPLFVDLVEPRARRRPVPAVAHRSAAPLTRPRRPPLPLFALLLGVTTIVIMVGHLFPLLILFAVASHMRRVRRGTRGQHPAMGSCASGPGMHRMDRYSAHN